MASQTLRAVALATTLFASICATAMAQTSAPAAGASESHLVKPAELEQLVAPIALYSDPLLAEVLMASTYPLEIVQAERWANAHKDLKGDELKAAVAKQPWDASIKALVAAPSVLEMMSTKLDWTQKLGDAVIAQQADVMDAIQRLRAKAEANNKLTSTPQQTVTITQDQGKRVIAIAPTQPDTMYVPYYDPAVVYGDWPYPDYPPYYWPAPGYIAAGVIATGIAFGAGYALGRWGGYWGGGVNWGSNNIVVNRPIGGGNNIGNNWNRGAHVEHRGNRRGGREQGLNFRGRGGQQVLKPGGGRAGLGEHRATTRPSHGNRGGRLGAGTRPSHRAAVRPGGGGRAGLGGHGGIRRGGGGGAHALRGGHGGGGFRSGGRGGGRRSDIRLKHDIVYLGRLHDGLGFYRFSYNGSSKAYVGVMAQEVQQVEPQAVGRGRDGYLRVNYEKLGLEFESYDRWVRSGAQIPFSVRLSTDGWNEPSTASDRVPASGVTTARPW